MRVCVMGKNVRGQSFLNRLTVSSIEQWLPWQKVTSPCHNDRTILGFYFLISFSTEFTQVR